jgi:hypothetical protein
MTQSLSTTRRLSQGWIDLASLLADAPARRRPAFALTQPVVFRSECFAEDLEELAPGGRAEIRPGTPRHNN